MGMLALHGGIRFDGGVGARQGGKAQPGDEYMLHSRPSEKSNIRFDGGGEPPRRYYDDRDCEKVWRRRLLSWLFRVPFRQELQHLFAVFIGVGVGVLVEDAAVCADDPRPARFRDAALQLISLPSSSLMRPTAAARPWPGRTPCPTAPCVVGQQRLLQMIFLLE